MKSLTICFYSGLSLLLAGLLSACGGGSDSGGNDTPPITANLSAKALEIVTLDPRIGYPLQVSVSIDAVEATQDVGLAFFAVDKDRSIVRQIALGTGSISQVTTGTASYMVDLDIPSIVETPGDYFIGVVVDAANIVAETDEADNDASTIATLSIDPVPNLFIENMEADRTAIELQENSSFEDQTLPKVDENNAPLENVVNSDAGATLTWGVKGTEVPIEVEAYAVLRLTRTASSGATPLSQSRDALTIAPTPAGADTSISHDIPLYLWNSEEVRYMNAYGRDTSVTCIPDFSNPCAPTLPIEYLPVGPIGERLVPAVVTGEPDVPVTEFDRKSAHLDFYFPGKLAQEIGIAVRGNNVPFGAIIPPPDLSQSDIQALRSFMPTGLPQEVTAAFCVNIRPVVTTIVEDSVADNDICTPVALLLPALPPLPPVPPSPPPTPPLLTTPTNPVAFEQLYRNAWGGSYFGFGISFSASATADNRGAIINGQGSIPAQVFGQTIEFIRVEGRAQVLPISDRDNPPAGQSPGFSLSYSHLGLIVRSIQVTSGSVGPLEISVSKDVAKKERIIAVGPVPVKLEGSLSGSLGVKYKISINENIDGDPTGEGINLITTPFANAEIRVAASVTAFIADVGVEGVLTLFEEEFNIIAGASINVLDSRHTTDFTSEIKIVPRLRVINVLTGAKGAVNVFVSVEVPVFRDCSWGFFTGICPDIAEVKYPYNLASYTAWEKSDVLFDQSFIIHVLSIPGEPVAYFK